ncbi:MAG: hypothetical protein P8X74_03780 [Reinekea sp.]
MRMNAARMKTVAAYAAANGITKTAKDLLTFEGNEMVDYSFKGNLETCKRAVVKAVKWAKADKKRRKNR